ncbi:hypothetical protein WKS98_03285 [Lagierella sp. ICN-221743]
MAEKLTVLRLEDAIEVVIDAINHYEYAYSIDALVANAKEFMECRSFEIERD